MRRHDANSQIEKNFAVFSAADGRARYAADNRFGQSHRGVMAALRLPQRRFDWHCRYISGAERRRGGKSRSRTLVL